MASPSHCCVLSLATSLTAWECASATKSPPCWLENVAVRYDVGLESLHLIFFWRTTKTGRIRKIPRNWLHLLLLKFGSICCQMGLMHIDSWKVLHPVTPTPSAEFYHWVYQWFVDVGGDESCKDHVVGLSKYKFRNQNLACCGYSSPPLKTNIHIGWKLMVGLDEFSF